MQNLAMYGILFELPQFFSELRGATSREVGHTLFVMMLGMFASSAIGGRLTDRVGARTAALAGLLPTALGVGWLSRIASFSVPRDAAGALLLLGIGIGLSTAPSQAAAMASVGPERSGMAAGMSSMLRYLGGVLSILVLGTVLGPGAPTVANHESAIGVFAVALALAGLASLGLPGVSAGREERAPARP
jgi:MFS family permease